MHPISTDHAVGRDAAAVGESQRDTLRVLINADQLAVELHHARRQHGFDGSMQVCPVHQQIGRAIFTFDFVAQRQFVGDLAGIPLAAIASGRVEGRLPQARFGAQLAVHFHGIRRLLNARAHSAKTRRLIVDRDVESQSGEKYARTQAAYPGADDSNRSLILGHDSVPLLLDDDICILNHFTPLRYLGAYVCCKLLRRTAAHIQCRKFFLKRSLIQHAAKFRR